MKFKHESYCAYLRGNIIHVAYIIKPKQKIWRVTSRNHYSTSKSNPPSFDLYPVPILIIDDLDNKDCITSYRKWLKGKAGIYSFINTENGNQYIGSDKDFYLRLNEHLNNKKYNVSLHK